MSFHSEKNRYLHIETSHKLKRFTMWYEAKFAGRENKPQNISVKIISKSFRLDIQFTDSRFRIRFF
jgi:hypothetical protein